MLTSYCNCLWYLMVTAYCIQWQEKCFPVTQNDSKIQDIGRFLISVVENYWDVHTREAYGWTQPISGIF